MHSKITFTSSKLKTTPVVPKITHYLKNTELHITKFIMSVFLCIMCFIYSYIIEVEDQIYSFGTISMSFISYLGI